MPLWQWFYLALLATAAVCAVLTLLRWRSTLDRWHKGGFSDTTAGSTELTAEIDKWVQSSGGLIGGLEALHLALDHRHARWRRGAGLLVLGGLLGTVIGLVGVSGQLAEVFRDTENSQIQAARDLGEALGNLTFAFLSTLVGVVGALVLRVVLLWIEAGVGGWAHEFVDWDRAIVNAVGPLERSAKRLDEVSDSLLRLVGSPGEGEQRVGALVKTAAALDRAALALQEGVNAWEARLKAWRQDRDEAWDRWSREMKEGQGALDRVIDKMARRQEAEDERVRVLLGGLEAAVAAGTETIGKKIAAGAAEIRRLIESGTGHMEGVLQQSADAHAERLTTLRLATRELTRHITGLVDRADNQTQLFRGIQEALDRVAGATQDLVEGAESRLGDIGNKHVEALDAVAAELRSAFTGAEQRWDERWRKVFEELHQATVALNGLMSRLTNERDRGVAEKESLKRAADAVAEHLMGLEGHVADTRNVMQDSRNVMQDTREIVILIEEALRRIGDRLAVLDDAPRDRIRDEGSA